MEPLSSDTAYSPDVSAELTLRGERFAVAALGGETVVVRSPRPVPPGRGTIRIVINGEVTVYNVDLWRGIDPDCREQAFRMIEVAAVA